jgi:CDP-diacylglycerol--glycerol-3-phosphate 3-phosphatidyltransferase
MRSRTKTTLELAGGFLLRLGIQPLAVTLAGVVGHMLAAASVAQGDFLVAGIFLVFVAPFDALDGAMARLKGEASRLGAFIDSVADRYAELILYGGLLIFYQRTDNQLIMTLVFVAAAGSVLVSYTRARAEGLGFEVRIGILTRFERYLVLIPSFLIGIPELGIGVVAVLTNITALQRILEVRKLSRNYKIEGDT